MFRKICLICGLVAPILYIGTVICGAALYPGYSHMVNAISELLSYGALNKAVLDIIFNVYGALLLLFAIGATLSLRQGPRLCRVAMGLFIAIQIISFSWGFFPMDPIGTAPTFAGTMHNVFGGVVALASILMPLLMGLGLRRKPGMHSYSLYALISAVVIFVSGLTGVVLSSQGVQLFGLFERVTIGTYEAWIFVTALMMVKGGKLLFREEN